MSKIAFIGSHGVGKTTLVYGLAARLKARDVSLEVLVEVARRCPLPLNRETTLAAQSWILHTQIADEVVASARYPVVLCDRSVLDNYIYLLLAAGSQKRLEALVAGWLETYDLFVQVPVVAGAEVLDDGIRSTDRAFQREVDEHLEREVTARGLQTLRLDPENRDRWLDGVEAEVLDMIRPPQMKLL